MTYSIRVVKSIIGNTLLVITFLSAGGVLAQTNVLQQAQQSLSKGDAKAAFALLEPLQSQYAGDPQFDYLLGIAALDSGNPDIAVFALERVLAVNPNDTRARAELARAYYVLGENESAKQEFQNVQKEQIPPEVNITIQKYLDAIDRRSIAANNTTRVRGYVEATAGHDSNVNSATADSEIAIPLFGGAIFTLDSTSTKLSSPYYAVSSGVNITYPLSNTIALTGAVNGSQRVYRQQDQFDVKSLDGSFGFSYGRPDNQVRVALQTQEFYLDNNRYRNFNGLISQWQRTLDAQNQISVYGQVGHITYTGNNSVRDINQYLVGSAWAHVFHHRLSPLFFLSGYGGKESPLADDREDIGKDFFGIRVGGQLTFNSKITGFAVTSAQSSRYGAQDPLFQVTREDTEYNLALGISYVPAKNWTIKPQVAYTKNSSNIAINDFSRTDISITGRFDF